MTRKHARLTSDYQSAKSNVERLERELEIARAWVVSSSKALVEYEAKERADELDQMLGDAIDAGYQLEGN